MTSERANNERANEQFPKAKTYTPDDYEIVVARSEENGGFVARCTAIPACSTRGNTPIEALTNAQRAIADHLDQSRKLGMPDPDPSSEPALSVTPATLEQDVEDILGDLIDLLVAHTEGPDAFSISRKVDEDTPEILWFVVTPLKGKTSGILIGREGGMAETLRIITRHLGYAHGRQFRCVINTPPVKPDGSASRPRRSRNGSKSD